MGTRGGPRGPQIASRNLLELRRRSDFRGIPFSYTGKMTVDKAQYPLFSAGGAHVYTSRTFYLRPDIYAAIGPEGVSFTGEKLEQILKNNPEWMKYAEEVEKKTQKGRRK